MNYLLLGNWERLGLLPQELEAWKKFRTQWNKLYQVYSNRKESRTIAITAKIHGLQKRFTVFSSRLLIRMRGMPYVTLDDAAVFHFIINRKDPTHSITLIKEIPEFGVTPLGGGVVRISVYPIHTDSRARKLPGAEIEMHYHVGASVTKPFNQDDLTQHHISTRAIFIFDFKNYRGGNTIYVSLRWIVISNPERNGPWSAIYKVALA